jgi:predicted nucleic acid-binding protein
MTTYVVIEINGMTELPHNRRIYFDSNAFIYAIEGVDEVAALLHSLFAALRRQSSLACTSEFTLAEVLPKANVVQRGMFDLLPVTRDILIETADYRSRVRPSLESKGSMPKLPDAIHVVTAIRAGCNTFVSFDRGLKLPVGLDRVGEEDGRLLQLVQGMS